MRKSLYLLLMLTVLGCAGKQIHEAPVTLEFRQGETTPKEGFTEMTVWDTDRTVYLSQQVALSNQDVKSASVSKGTGGYQIEVTFTDAGAQKFAEVTRQNVMKPLGIVIDGRSVSAPVVRDVILGGKAVITGNFSQEEANRLAEGIAAGSR